MIIACKGYWNCCNQTLEGLVFGRSVSLRNRGEDNIDMIAEDYYIKKKAKD